MKWQEITKGINRDEFVEFFSKNDKEIEKLRYSNPKYVDISSVKAVEILYEQGKLIK